MIQILLTNRCNNTCCFCAADCPGTELLPAGQVKEFLTEAFSAKVQDNRVFFSGGEPTLHPDLPELVEFCSRALGANVGVITNSRVFAGAPELASILAKKGLRWALASLYAPDPVLHDELVGVRGSWNQTVGGIRTLLEAGVFVEVRQVVSRPVVHTLGDFVRFARAEFPDAWRYSVVSLDYDGRALQHTDRLHVPLDVVAREFQAAADVAFGLDVSFRMVCFPLCLLAPEYWDLVIPAEGVPEHFLSWEKSTHEFSRTRFLQLPGCADCVAAGLCPGIAKSYASVIGDFEARPPTGIALMMNPAVRLTPTPNGTFLCDREGNWLVVSEPELQPHLASGRLAALPLRTQREMVRQGFARPEGYGRHLAIIRRNESVRGKPVEEVPAERQNLFIVNVTNRCNLGCRYCYAQDNPVGEELPVSKLVDACLGSGEEAVCIEFHGGEPLLRFQEIRETVYRVKRASQRHKFLIVTNGTLITDEVADFFRQSGTGVIVSLDGPENVHDRNRVYRRGCGSYRDVMAGVDRLLQHAVDFSINSVVTADDATEIHAVYDHHVCHGLLRFKLIPVVPNARHRQAVDRTAFGRTLVELSERVAEASRAGTRVELLNCYYVLLALLFLNRRYLCMSRPCGGGAEMLTLDPQGRVFPCHKLAGYLDWQAGSIRGDRIVQTDAMKSFLDARNPLTAECEGCAYGVLCGGV